MIAKVGLMVGREWSFPPAFIDEVNRRDADVVAEFVKLGGTRQEVTCPWCEGTGRFIPDHDAQAARVSS